MKRDEPKSEEPEHLEPADAATRLRAILARPAGARLRRSFARFLRDQDYPPGVVLPWQAAHLGAADPREAVPRAFRQAERTLARLRPLTPQRRRRSLSQARREVVNPALLDAFITEAQRHLCTDPAEAPAWLDLAQGVVPRLASARFPEPLLTPALLRIAAHRANALRVAGELPAAAALFARLAADPRRPGLGRPDIEAELLSLEASLRIDLRQFAQAETLLTRAQSTYRRLGDPVGQAQALLKRGSAADYSGEPERAVDFEQHAAEILDPEAEPALYTTSRHNLADSLVSAGRPAEAAAVLATHRELFERHADPADRLRRQWTEARIARAEERFDAAECGFAAVRNGWLSFGRAIDAALAALDAAKMHLVRGNWRQVRRLAELLAPIFEARGVYREAMTARLLFQKAARKERLTAAFLARLLR